MAVSDELRILTRGLETLQRKSKRVDLERIGEVVHRLDIGEIVVGHPVRLGGEASSQTGKVAALADELRARFNIPVQLWDERLTSVAAEEMLGKHRSVKQRIADRKSGAVDRMAAVLILQSYLDAHRPAAGTRSFDAVRNLAERYAHAWSSHNPASVADCYSPAGWLRVNDDLPAIGRDAIAEVARGFMTAFPDLRVLMDGLVPQDGGYVFLWTLIGDSTGPGGTGMHVHISGFEEWRIGADGLIAESRGHFDAAEYQRQLAQGADQPR